MLCTVSGDASVRLWDVRSRAAVHNLTISGKNRNVAWRPDSSAMAVSNDKDVISFIDVKTFKVVDKLNRGKAVNEMTWDKTGEMFLVTTGTGIVEVMSYPELGTPINQLKAHMSSACCIAVDSTGQHFATGGTDALVSLWDAESFCCLNSFAKLDSPVKSLGFDHCGKYLAYTSEDCVLSFVEVATGALVHEEVTKSPLQHLAWSPTRPAIAYVGDVEKGKEVLSIYKLEAS
ncbi:WD40 repeat domain-containing protein [Chloropicon primus]|uniref:WD40 repeat domain-containing protein n=1 Tax=Chloropicon primus TaxID=1764295 RepID=A0A5B8MVE6_9CHLO|nr:WD40 repeat domain-containing protein [Chloropicon primus]|eukprot:QDZ23625.1 WD40 repeat domain-containing protein [Chloropicon primus]